MTNTRRGHALRVRYNAGQHLRTKDFKDEQSYHLELSRSHNLTAHQPGVLSGLLPIFDVEAGQFFVDEGIAIAGDGTEIRLLARHPVLPEEFDKWGSDELGVWLGYKVLTAPAESSRFGGCCPSEAAGAGRSHDQALVVVQPLNLAAIQSKAKGRIFLGKLVRDFANPDALFSVDLRGRDYAGLIGSRIEAPSGRARLEVGETRSRPFAVYVNESDPALSVDSEGRLHISHDATVEGDLRLTRGYLQFGEAPKAEFSRRVETPQPWKIYRGSGHKLVAPASEDVGSSGDETILSGDKVSGPDENKQLRIELPSDQLATFVVGSVPAEGEAFVPVLTVSNQGSVTVHGDLIVEKAIRGEREPAELSQEARVQLFSGVLKGTETSLELIKAFNQTVFGGAGEIVRELATNEPEVLVSAIMGGGKVSEFLRILASKLSEFQVGTLVNELLLTGGSQGSRRVMVSALLKDPTLLGQDVVEAAREQEELPALFVGVAMGSGRDRLQLAMELEGLEPGVLVRASLAPINQTVSTKRVEVFISALLGAASDETFFERFSRVLVQGLSEQQRNVLIEDLGADRSSVLSGLSVESLAGIVWSEISRREDLGESESTKEFLVKLAEGRSASSKSQDLNEMASALVRADGGPNALAETFESDKLLKEVLAQVSSLSGTGHIASQLPDEDLKVLADAVVSSSEGGIDLLENVGAKSELSTVDSIAKALSDGARKNVSGGESSKQKKAFRKEWLAKLSAALSSLSEADE